MSGQSDTEFAGPVRIYDIISLGVASSVASVSGTMALNGTSSHYEVTGTESITAITHGGGQGTLLFLRFASTADVADAGDLILNGAFQGATDEYLVLINNGGGSGTWTEVGRSIA